MDCSRGPTPSANSKPAVAFAVRMKAAVSQLEQRRRQALEEVTAQESLGEILATISKSSQWWRVESDQNHGYVVEKQGPGGYRAVNHFPALTCQWSMGMPVDVKP
jgi:hypothetical protein